LRQFKGISGFPHYRESAYDIYLSGHASTAISWAQGISEAKRLKRNASKTVAVVGDGSLTGGLCFEALNSCGHNQSDVLVIVNHNEMSIARSVGALGNYLTKIISAPIYNRLKDELETFLEHFSIAKRLVQKARKFEESLKGLLVPGIFFEELGFRYFGPIDGHNLEVLIPTLKNIVSLSGPRILHVITKKGKGYSYSENNPEDFHGISLFDVETGTPAATAKKSFSESFAEKLVSLARSDKKIVAITAAMANGTGLYIFKKKYPRRFFDVGIAESHAVSFASGLAKEGMKPVVAIYSTFLQRGFDQIIHDVALQNIGVVFAVDRAGLVGEDGPTHHGLFDISYLRCIPNMVCMAPKDKEELQQMLEYAFSLGKPTSIRFPRGEAYSLGKTTPLEYGKAEVIASGEDVCLLAVGSMVKTGKDCLSLLSQQNIHACLVNMRFIKPLDGALLRRVAGKFSHIVTLEEGVSSGGFGSAVKEFYEQARLLNTVTLMSVGLPGEFIPAGRRELLLRMYGLDAQTLAMRIQKMLAEPSVWRK